MFSVYLTVCVTARSCQGINKSETWWRHTWFRDKNLKISVWQNGTLFRNLWNNSEGNSYEKNGRYMRYILANFIIKVDLFYPTFVKFWRICEVINILNVFVQLCRNTQHFLEKNSFHAKNEYKMFLEWKKFMQRNCLNLYTVMVF